MSNLANLFHTLVDAPPGSTPSEIRAARKARRKRKMRMRKRNGWTR